MDGRLRCMTSLYLTRDDGVLCLYRIGSRVADRMFIGSAGGHFEPDELNDARACVLREAREELGLTEGDLDGLTMRYITLRLKNGEIRQNYYFFARLKEEKPLESTEGLLKWVAWEDLPALHMPVSAKHMILHYAAHGRFDNKLYVSVTGSEEPENALFSELCEF